jgi:hypothetical protein
MADDGEQGSIPNSAASPARPRSNWTASRVIGMVFASIGGLIGLHSNPSRVSSVRRRRP